MLIDTPLLVTGTGPCALLVAKFASGRGLASLVVGHISGTSLDPVRLGEASVELLTPHGLLDVFRPYLASAEPPAIAPALFEEVLKHHCVADMNVTVYDGMELADSVRSGAGLTATLTDGRATWEVRADRYVDASALPTALDAAVPAAAAVADEILNQLT